MLHIIQVDQSGKVEDTAQDTILALANGITFTIRIPSTVKRECITTLRRSGITGKTMYNQLFATGLFFLLKDKIQELDKVIIDIEYIGREAQIKEHLVQLLRRAHGIVESQRIQFGYIGEHTAADEIARQTLHKKRKPDEVIRLEMILGEFKTKKNRGSPLGEKT
jgi:hypothetical protein